MEGKTHEVSRGRPIHGRVSRQGGSAGECFIEFPFREADQFERDK